METIIYLLYTYKVVLCIPQSMYLLYSNFDKLGL